jgi:hypothetical protein
MINIQHFKTKLEMLPDGAYDVFYHTKRYALTKSTHLEGKLIKLYAKELGGNDFISLNYYTKLKEGLKPCEMPKEKVIDFVVRLIKD